MDKLLQNTNVSILLLLVIILVLLFLIWHLIKDKQNKLKVSVEDYNKLINQIRELQIENRQLKQNQEPENINQKIDINPIRNLKKESRLFNGNFPELIEEFRKGISKKFFVLFIVCLNEESDEFYEALNIESKWRTIQNFKIEGTVDASALILEETKISNSILLNINSNYLSY